ncbi:GNAT family N-acetyltransferase [Cohnella endophytica]|uniref:GNAT family N-acetyltransferase n=1 Tax=Cohnella endophytica TaxID=2419778 RepID=A0A494Y298_9BACL|nr:GNAT family N-acetyltransferase [Cohnella endophytica]RKP56877.1 GNAT family N-acetyltransferase [Cohnella endophytica]
MINCIKVETEDQLRQAFGIRLEVFVEEQGVPRELEMDEYDASPAACHHFLVLNEEQCPIATGRFKTFEPGVAKMQRIAVLKSQRGKGIGKHLLLDMEQAAKNLGYETSLLDAQCSAEVFYGKLGYRTISEEPFLDADILHVRMSKSL